MAGVAPPGPALTYVQGSVQSLYDALVLVQGVPGPNDAAVLGKAITALQALLTSWYVNGVS